MGWPRSVVKRWVACCIGPKHEKGERIRIIHLFWVASRHSSTVQERIGPSGQIRMRVRTLLERGLHSTGARGVPHRRQGQRPLPGGGAEHKTNNSTMLPFTGSYMKPFDPISWSELSFTGDIHSCMSPTFLGVCEWAWTSHNDVSCMRILVELTVQHGLAPSR